MCLLRASATVPCGLRLLEMCPLMPVDAFVPIVGLHSWTPGISNSHGCGAPDWWKDAE